MRQAERGFCLYSCGAIARAGADEYKRLCDQPGVDGRDGVGLSEKIDENTGVRLNVAVTVIAIANSARHNSNKE